MALGLPLYVVRQPPSTAVRHRPPRCGSGAGRGCARRVITAPRTHVAQVGSAVVCAMAVTNAFMTKQQFYPAVIYLATSKANTMVTRPVAPPPAPGSGPPRIRQGNSADARALQTTPLHFPSQVLGNMAMAMLVMCGRMLKWLFFGTLRDAEMEVRWILPSIR